MESSSVQKVSGEVNAIVHWVFVVIVKPTCMIVIAQRNAITPNVMFGLRLNIYEVDDMQTNLLTWIDEEKVVIPDFFWQFHGPCGTGKALGYQGSFALYLWSDYKTDPFQMWWFDVDGECEDWSVCW